MPGRLKDSAICLLCGRLIQAAVRRWRDDFVTIEFAHEDERVDTCCASVTFETEAAWSIDNERRRLPESIQHTPLMSPARSRELRDRVRATPGIVETHGVHPNDADELPELPERETDIPPVPSPTSASARIRAVAEQLRSDADVGGVAPLIVDGLHERSVAANRRTNADVRERMTRAVTAIGETFSQMIPAAADATSAIAGLNESLSALSQVGHDFALGEDSIPSRWATEWRRILQRQSLRVMGTMCRHGDRQIQAVVGAAYTDREDRIRPYAVISAVTPVCVQLTAGGGGESVPYTYAAFADRFYRLLRGHDLGSLWCDRRELFYQNIISLRRLADDTQTVHGRTHTGTDITFTRDYFAAFFVQVTV